MTDTIKINKTNVENIFKSAHQKYINKTLVDEFNLNKVLFSSDNSKYNLSKFIFKSGELNTYKVIVDPFVGNGSFVFEFLHKNPSAKAYVSDPDPHMVTFYKYLRDRGVSLILEITGLVDFFLESDNKADFYYSILSLFNKSTTHDLLTICYYFFLLKYSKSNTFKLITEGEDAGLYEGRYGGERTTPLSMLEFSRYVQLAQRITLFNFNNLPKVRGLYIYNPYVESEVTLGVLEKMKQRGDVFIPSYGPKTTDYEVVVRKC